MFCCCGPQDEEILLTDIPSAHVLDQESRVQVSGTVSRSFRVNVMLGEQAPRQLGLKVDNSDERGSMILEITEGVIQHFNDQNPEKAICVYDRILTVNGEPTAISELHRLRASSIAKGDSGSLELQVSRPQVLTVTCLQSVMSCHVLMQSSQSSVFRHFALVNITFFKDPPRCSYDRSCNVLACFQICYVCRRECGGMNTHMYIIRNGCSICEWHPYKSPWRVQSKYCNNILEALRLLG